MISIKYKYGCIIYINGNEVFRKGLSDTIISVSSTSSNTYDEVIYRQISLPIKSDRETNDDKVVFFVKGGLNVIAIGLVTANNQGQEQISNPFDCALRLMSDQKESRVFDYDASSEEIAGSSANNILTQYYVYSMSSETCDVNSFTINFNNDRHEWINSVTLTLAHLQKTDQPRQFSFEARNENENGGAWTRLLDMSNIEWLESENSKTFYFYNNKAYNQYRFINFGSGDSNSCKWELGTLDLNLVSTVFDISDLAYETSSPLIVYKYERIEDIYPNSEYYYDFSVNPALPNGLTIDSITGVISGSPLESVDETLYTISAYKMTGELTSTELTLTVNECSGTLVNVLRTYGAQGAQNEYFTIKDSSSGDVVLSVNANDGQQDGETKSYYLCLTANKYEVTIGANGQFWYVSFVYIRTVLSTNEMETILRMRYDNYMHLATTRTFNPLYSIPSHSDWYYYTGQTIPNNWYNTNLDMNTDWSETNVDSLPSTIPTNHIQLYRKSFTISDVISNIGGFVISIKYKYGCIIYINGNEVFRKGLSDTLISESSTSSNTYDEVIYRQISLPIQIVKNKGDSTVSEYIKFGSNTIAIG